MMTEQEFLTRFDNGDRFTESECKELVLDTCCVEEIAGDCDRWYQHIRTIFETENGRVFSLSWTRGLTVYQENEYLFQPIEVQKHEYQKTITVTEWIPINKNKGD